MAYFSSKSTWLSLIEGVEPPAAPLPPEDLHLDLLPARGDADSESAEPGWEAVDAEGLRVAQGLRHRLFFQHREWEFGPALLRDNFRLARLQANPEEALAYYGFARHVAQALAEECGHLAFLPAWLEADRLIADTQLHLGNAEGCRAYAREGLDLIRRNKFAAPIEERVAQLTEKFLKLLGYSVSP